MPAPAGSPGRILAAVAAAQVLAIAAATSIAVALPPLARDLGASGSAQQWIVDAFVLVFASLLVAGGVLGDRRGRRRVLLAGLGLFALGSVICAVAPSTGALVAGRVVQGLGPPLVLPASLAIVTAAYADPAERARAIGLWGAGSGLGVTLGPLLGGGLVEAFGWRAVFAVNVPVVALLVVAIVREVPADRPARAEHPFDVVGAVLVTAATAALVFGLIEGRPLGWGSAPVPAAFAVAAAGLALFARYERRHPAPLVDVAILRHRAFAAANLGAASIFFALLGTAVYVSVFFQQVQGRDAFETGLALLPQGAATALLAPVAGRLTARVGPRPPMLAGLALTAVASAVLVVRLDADAPLADLWWVFALLGAGAGIALPAMTATAVGAVPAARAGMASAIHNASRQLGQTLGVAVLGTIVLSGAGEAADGGGRLTGPAAEAFVGGLHEALLAAAALVVLVGGAVAALVR